MMIAMNAILFDQLTWGWIALAVITFLYLLRRNAPYGRHVEAGWGPTVSNRVGWFIMEFTVSVVFLLALLSSGKLPEFGPVWVFIGCFLLHYINRSIVFPLRMRTTGKRRPLVIVLSAMTFNLVNDFLLGYFFGHFAQYTAEWWTDPRFLAGLALFWGGLALNWQADHVLIHLRKPGQTGYVIPKGGWFEKISCPNLFGEMLEWTGFALMAWCLPGLSFMIWTIANLAPRALAHHRWYQRTFPDYPEERKALIPFVL